MSDDESETKMSDDESETKMSDDGSDQETEKPVTKTPVPENTFGHNKFSLLSAKLKKDFTQKVGGDLFATLIDELFYFFTHAMQPKFIYPEREFEEAIRYCLRNYNLLPEKRPNKLVHEFRSWSPKSCNAIVRYVLYIQTRMNYLFCLPRDLMVSSVSVEGFVTVNCNLKYNTGKKRMGKCSVQFDDTKMEFDVDLAGEFVLDVGTVYAGEKGEIRIKYCDHQEVVGIIPALET